MKEEINKKVEKKEEVEEKKAKIRGDPIIDINFWRWDMLESILQTLRYT